MVVVEVRDAEYRDVVTLAHDEDGVDDPDLADVAEPCQLGGDAALEEVIVREADDERLNRSDGHADPPVRCRDARDGVSAS